MIGGKHHFDATRLRRQLREPIRVQNAFHLHHVPLISRLKPMKYVYPEHSDAKAYS